MSQLPEIADSTFPQCAGIYYSVDSDGRLLQWNSEFEYVTGRVSGDLMGRKLLDVIMVGDRAIVQQALDDALRRGMNEFCARIDTSDGTVEYLFRLLANIDEKGNQRSITGVAQRLLEQNRQWNELDIINTRLREQQSALLQLSRNRFNNTNYLEQLQIYATEIVARTLRVERVSLWLFDDMREKIECQDLFQHHQCEPARVPALNVADFPVYFRTIDEGRCLAADDALSDPFTEELADVYLKPQGIVAMLDAPLRIAGQVVGVLCCEHLGESRHWHLDEENFVASVADYLALNIEIDQHRRSQEALACSLNEWDYAMDAVEDIIYMVDLDDCLIRANQNFFQTTGLQEWEICGQNIARFLHPQSWEQAGTGFKHREVTLFMERDDPYNFTGHPVELIVRIVKNRNGEPYALLNCLRDLSKVRAAEDAYHDLHEYIDTLMESTSEGIIGVDRELRCTFVNQAAMDMLGFSASDMQGQDIHMLIQHSSEDSKPLQKKDSKIARSISEGRGFRVESAVLWTKSKRCIHVRYSSNPTYEHGEISGAVLVFRNMSESMAMASQMDYLASHDALTGLLNRYEFDRCLKKALKGARLKNERHVLFYMDLDQFKVVNDTSGHLAGDELLKRLSRILQKEVRNGDTLARLGGDEFGVLLKSCDLNQARQVSKKLQRAVRNFRFHMEDKTFSIGVSIGIVEIAAYSQGDDTNVLSLADSACFLAKEEGRNRIHIYHRNDEDLARQHGEMQWVSRIQTALEQDLLEIFCQRIVPVGRSNEGVGHVEVLVRMIDENGETIPPGAFIPAAERYNLMSELDRWVINHTFAWLRDNRESMAHMITTINISGQSLGDERFLNDLISMLSSYDIAPTSICFEITETAAVGNLSSAVSFIKDLKSLGCKFALDDFGSGMSSFAYLKNLPVDYLKIDGSLVKDIATDVVNFSMVEAINRVGRVMGLQTIAEFVENQAILEKLEEIGVDYAQGFGVARPVSSKHFKP
ncbi:MAG TPA: EAL domain-containing protein [Gammaproteobacteria bacterium]|nr:EAL domain-containing protein [Gammaproteobacteria bacterium]